MLSDHRLERYNEEKHLGIIYAAALQGVDIAETPGHTRFIGYGRTKNGYGPVGIVDLDGTEYVAEPHISWFPWVTPANKIVNFKWAMGFLGQDKEVIVAAEEKERNFFDHFVKRGVLRYVGYFDNMPKVNTVQIYQYIRSSENE